MALICKPWVIYPLVALAGLWLFLAMTDFEILIAKRESQGLYMCRYLTPWGVDMRVMPEPCLRLWGH